MKERIIQWFLDNKITITTLLTGLIAAIVGAGCLSGCIAIGGEDTVRATCDVINGIITNCVK